MEKKNEQHSRQKFIEEQLAALKQEEKALNDSRLALLNQKWQIQSEHEKLKRKIVERDEMQQAQAAEPGTSGI
ncbi:hypothetical protein GCK72_001490 [Caenorhabditis remanei]|uniref:Uncharacterized protein n=1 Tax=Caenorhabditis remanei TaxID=31234 RepID=E3N1P6_CAERE|nr:hypothetical protein GCK72_001490 [Caenorhabditis remanei]EFO83762.1 hypothetical protein CRE_14213 [Caenorhabditis remanei]KAF1769673.1 hypothetical protein GCK72_001490 [Caenorhabditis remanei]